MTRSHCIDAITTAIGLAVVLSLLLGSLHAFHSAQPRQAALSRAWPEKPATVITVPDAACSGITDASQALQSFIDTAARWYHMNGSTVKVHLPEGQCGLRHPLDIPGDAGLELEGGHFYLSEDVPALSVGRTAGAL